MSAYCPFAKQLSNQFPSVAPAAIVADAQSHVGLFQPALLLATGSSCRHKQVALIPWAGLRPALPAFSMLSFSMDLLWKKERPILARYLQDTRGVHIATSGRIKHNRTLH